jgi:hypothetical protein
LPRALRRKRKLVQPPLIRHRNQLKVMYGDYRQQPHNDDRYDEVDPLLMGVREPHPDRLSHLQLMRTAAGRRAKITVSGSRHCPPAGRWEPLAASQSRGLS